MAGDRASLRLDYSSERVVDHATSVEMSVVVLFTMRSRRGRRCERASDRFVVSWSAQ